MKRFLSLFLCLTLLLSMGVLATGTEAPSEQAEPTAEFVYDYALSFMQGSRPSAEITIDEFLPLYSPDGETVTGYYVTYQNAGVPEGYALLSLINGGCPVVEFAFEGEGLIATSGAPALPSGPQHAPSANRPKILFGGADALFVPTGSGYYSVYDHEPVSADEATDACEAAAPPATLDFDMGGIIDWANSNVVDSSVFKIQDFGAGTDYFLMRDFSLSDTNCMPTAAANVLWYWSKRGSKEVNQRLGRGPSKYDRIAPAYDLLYKGMTNPISGRLDNNRTLDGFKNFFGGIESMQGGVWTSGTPTTTLDINFYRDALNNNCPVIVYLAPNGNTGTQGHAVFNFGYARSSTGTNYLFVMDGYNSYGRFVKVGYYGYMHSYKIWINPAP